MMETPSTEVVSTLPYGSSPINECRNFLLRMSIKKPRVKKSAPVIADCTFAMGKCQNYGCHWPKFSVTLCVQNGAIIEALATWKERGWSCLFLMTVLESNEMAELESIINLNLFFYRASSTGLYRLGWWSFLVCCYWRSKLPCICLPTSQIIGDISTRVDWVHPVSNDLVWEDSLMVETRGLERLQWSARGGSSLSTRSTSSLTGNPASLHIYLMSWEKFLSPAQPLTPLHWLLSLSKIQCVEKALVGDKTECVTSLVC